MSRVRNADEFLLRFRGIQKAYDNRFAPFIAQIREMYAGTPEENLLDQSQELTFRTQ